MDVVRLAAAFGLTGGKFVLEHTETDEDGDISLRLAPDGSCIFLNEGRCTVYEARPFQCRAYPFLPTTDYSPVASSSDWRSERRLCPGIGKGRFYRKAEIEAISRDRDETAGFEV